MTIQKPATFKTNAQLQTQANDLKRQTSPSSSNADLLALRFSLTSAGVFALARKSGKTKNTYRDNVRKTDRWITNGNRPFKGEVPDVFDADYKPEKRPGFKIPSLGNPVSLFGLQSVATSVGENLTNQNPAKIKRQTPAGWSFPGIYLPGQEIWDAAYGNPPLVKVPDNLKPVTSDTAPADTRFSYANIALGTAVVLGAGALALKFGSASGAGKLLAKFLPEAKAALPEAEQALVKTGFVAKLARIWDEIKVGARVLFDNNMTGGLTPSTVNQASGFFKMPVISKTENALFSQSMHFTSSGKHPFIDLLDTEIDTTVRDHRDQIVERSTKIVDELKKMSANITHEPTLAKINGLIGKFEGNTANIENLSGDVSRRIDAPGDLRRLHAWTQDYINDVKVLVSNNKSIGKNDFFESVSFKEIKSSFDKIAVKADNLKSEKNNLDVQNLEAARNKIIQEFTDLQKYVSQHPLSESEKKILQDRAEEIASKHIFETYTLSSMPTASGTSLLSKKFIVEASRGKVSIKGDRVKGIKRVK